MLIKITKAGEWQAVLGNGERVVLGRVLTVKDTDIEYTDRTVPQAGSRKLTIVRFLFYDAGQWLSGSIHTCSTLIPDAFSCCHGTDDVLLDRRVFRNYPYYSPRLASALPIGE